MLFETQAKADNFIKYNSEGILEENGKAPVRSYYCEMCGGYHVTSVGYLQTGHRRAILSSVSWWWKTDHIERKSR